MWLIYFILGGFARIWFGSDLESKIWGNRGLQTSFMLLLFLSIYVQDYTSWISWVVAIAITAWLQFQYWSRGHGIAIDVGDSSVSKADIDRYNKRWYHKLLDKFFTEEHRYGMLYDFFYLMLRYTCPIAVMMIFDWRYILVGLSVPFIYTFSNELDEREHWVFASNKWWWRRGWSLAEILVGGITYTSCYALGLGQ